MKVLQQNGQRRKKFFYIYKVGVDVIAGPPIFVGLWHQLYTAVVI